MHIRTWLLAALAVTAVACTAGDDKTTDTDLPDTDTVDTDVVDTDVVDTVVVDTDVVDTDVVDTDVDTDLVDTDPPAIDCQTLTTQIAALANPASDPWDAQVQPLLLACFDTDASGAVDTAAEVNAIPCPVWGALDDAAQAGMTTPFLALYGFEDGLVYVGDQLGFAVAVRDDVEAAVAACSGACAALPGDLDALPDPASATWDQAAAPLLIGCFDSDASGTIDTTAEVNAIPCPVWGALQRASMAGWTTPFITLYGFETGLVYAGNDLGFDEVVRADVVTAFDACPPPPMP